MDYLNKKLVISLLLIYTFPIFIPCLQVNASATITTTEWQGVSDVGLPTGIVILNGSIYFSDDWGVFGRLDPTSGNITKWYAPTSNSSVRFITAYDNLIYFAECHGNKIGRLDPSTGAFTEWDIPTVHSFPSGITIDNGLVYFTESSGNKIGRLDPSTGTFDEWSIPTMNSAPWGITISKGLIYFIECGSNKIGRLNASTGAFTEWDIPNKESQPRSVPYYNNLAAYNGLLYFTEGFINKIGRLDPSTGTFTEWDITTANSEPGAITIYNGLIYFTELARESPDGISKIGLLDPSTGHFMEWNVTFGRLPIGIAVYNGFIYYTVLIGNIIGRLDLSAFIRLRVDVESLYAVNSIHGIGEYYNGSVVNVSINQTTLDCGNGTRRIFSGWITNITWQTLNVTSPKLNFTLESNLKLVANWMTQYRLTVNVNPQGSGTVNALDWYNQGSTATIEVTPNSGYQFDSWSGDIVGSSSTITIQMNGPKEITSNLSSTFPILPVIGGIIIIAVIIVLLIYKSKK